MYQALYRKWRPQTFDEVVGQGHITDTLKNQVRSGRLSHAYIFIGTRGTGKTTCARILARAVNCESPVDGNPCGKCAACRGIADGSVLDVVELDAASNNGVDNVRALREEAVFSPASVKKRVYIIDEVHMLSTSAFNALLKILEEPPEHLMFILATTELQKVPATILSRCQRHSFRRIDAGQIAQYLLRIAGEEHFSLTPDAAELIARLADGGVRDALSLLDQCSAYEDISVDAVYSAMGLAGNRRIQKMLDNIIARDAMSALTEFDALWRDGKDPATFLKELSSLLREVLIFSVSPNGGSSLLSGSYEAAALGGFAARLTRQELIAAMETVQRYSAQLREVKDPKTVVELCLISLCDNTLGEDVNALGARIARLEAALASGEGLSAGALPRAEAAPGVRPDIAQPAAAVMVAHDAPAVPPVPTVTQAAPAPTGAGTAPAPVEAAPAEAPAANSPAPDAGGEVWGAICAAAAARLMPDLRLAVRDGAKVRGTLEGNILRIECLPGFVYGRFNKPEVIDAFSRAAHEVVGREIRVMLAELKAEAAKTRSVDELRQFKEVKFS